MITKQHGGIGYEVPAHKLINLGCSLQDAEYPGHLDLKASALAEQFLGDTIRAYGFLLDKRSHSWNHLIQIIDQTFDSEASRFAVKMLSIIGED